MSTSPLPEDWWELGDVATYLGVARGTVSGYRSRGAFPEPERVFGRSPAWRPATIRAWNDARRGQGWRRQGS